MNQMEAILLATNIITLIALALTNLKVHNLEESQRVGSRIVTGIGVAFLKSRGDSNPDVVHEFWKLANADYSYLVGKENNE